ncbi:hypothetical protein [Peptacetobacter hiranonis]|uniref:hypothetical protein n=1 Tax=Peptacetobacter hiranonis TaxID=89152 RepID=UPI0022E4E76C|nr:hypothetical protein [Peptacetobacter hiranonis]
MLFEKFFDKINEKYINKINFESVFKIAIWAMSAYIPLAIFISILSGDKSLILKINSPIAYFKVFILFVLCYILSYLAIKKGHSSNDSNINWNNVLLIHWESIILIYLPISSLVAMIFKDLSLLKPYEPLSYFKIFVCIVFSYILAYINLKHSDKKE